MRIVRSAIIAGIASAALAGAAFAGNDKSNMMLVALPDGSVEHIRYEGDVAPRVVLVPTPTAASFFEAAFGSSSPFAEMEAQAAAMMRQAATIQAWGPASNGDGVVLTNGAGQPVGVMQYSYVSSTTSADGCTRTVRISSSASTPQPNVIRTSAGNCSAARPSPAIVPASRPSRPVTSVTSAPTTRPAPKITPVSAPKPLPEFTPSIII